MRQALAALLGTALASAPWAALAQSSQGPSIVDQQQTLQTLLNGATTAVRNNDPVTACQLRSQALEVLNANFTAFSAAFPANDWSDLQRSLQGSVRKCGAQGT